MRKHEAFEKTLAAQAGRVEELERFAVELLADHHYDTAGITQRLQAVCARRDRLKETAMARRKRLQESRQLQQFLRNMYEVCSAGGVCVCMGAHANAHAVCNTNCANRVARLRHGFTRSSRLQVTRATVTPPTCRARFRSTLHSSWNCLPTEGAWAP